MYAVHIVSSLDLINLGVWSVVVSTFKELEKYGIVSELWSEGQVERPDLLENCNVNICNATHDLFNSIKSSFDPANCIIISHGSWMFPSQVGYRLKKIGYRWICYPHGMLEPWALKYRSLKKSIYLKLFEKRYLNKADAIVAVGRPEFNNLQRMFDDKVKHIHNGIEPYQGPMEKPQDTINFLFMARLHEKKGVLPLLKAWSLSQVANDSRYKLIVAGPDEGELTSLERCISENKLSNVVLAGAIYGEKKSSILKSSHFFVLPSQSEGFPTTIVESMTFGCIPVITDGCNFPEALHNGIAQRIVFDVAAIKAVIEQLATLTVTEIATKSKAAKEFADSNFSVKEIAIKQRELYNSICGKD